MVGEELHDFDRDLCDYVLGQIRPHLRMLPERPRSVPKLDYPQWNSLGLSVWLGRGVAALHAPLADHVWAGVSGDQPPLPLNDAELYALATVVDDPPMRCEDHAVWVPFPALHRRSVECVPEIQTALTKQTAEEWAEDSVSFAARLSQEGLSLADGVAAVHQWLWRARRLLRVMGAVHLLPYPVGTHPTPTQPDPPTRPADRPEPPAATVRVSPQNVMHVKPSEQPDSAVCGWREAMTVTGLKKTKLYDLFHRGVLKGYRDGQMIRFYRAGLVAYMRDRENNTAPPPRPARRPTRGRPPTPAMRFKFL